MICLATACSVERKKSASEIIIPSLNVDHRELSEARAIALAEEFILRNGYTTVPANKDVISYESIEPSSDIEEMLVSRHNTLVNKAFGVSRGRKGDSPGWTVVFSYVPSPKDGIRKNGRAVTMNLDGSDIRLEHVEFILAKVDRKL